MKFSKAIRKPSAFHEKSIDVTDEKQDFTWTCIECKETILVPLKERLMFPTDEFPRGGFTEEEKKEIKQFYAMGEHSRSPCGGGYVFERIPCSQCKTDYLLAYGINEPSNSYLILTIQGIVGLEEVEPIYNEKPRCQFIVCWRQSHCHEGASSSIRSYDEILW